MVAAERIRFYRHVGSKMINASFAEQWASAREHGGLTEVQVEGLLTQLAVQIEKAQDIDERVDFPKWHKQIMKCCGYADTIPGHHASNLVNTALGRQGKEFKVFHAVVILSL